MKKSFVCVLLSATALTLALSACSLGIEAPKTSAPTSMGKGVAAEQQAEKDRRAKLR